MNPTSQIEWIPVSARLPREDRECRYLVASSDRVFMATREEGEWGDVAVYRGGDGVPSRYVLPGITHWAELPDVSFLVRTVTDSEDVMKTS